MSTKEERLAALEKEIELEERELERRHPVFKEARLRREALERLLKKEPHPIVAPLTDERYTVLVHKSTRKRGWWQATTFDAEGPWGDTESESWHSLLKTINMDGVDWEKARPAKPHTVNATKRRKRNATFAGWTCPMGPESLVDWLVDRGQEVSYEEFAADVNLSTVALDESQIEILPTDWHVVWLFTDLPSGQDAWVMQHSGIEHLFTDAPFNYEREAALATAMAEIAAERDLGWFDQIGGEALVALRKAAEDQLGG